MVIDDTLLNKLEKLSLLKISDDKREEIKNQLDNILSFANILNELDLDNEEAAVTAIKGGTLLRDDIQKQSYVIDTILANSPSREDKFFVVPKIIE